MSMASGHIKWVTLLRNVLNSSRTSGIAGLGM